MIPVTSPYPDSPYPDAPRSGPEEPTGPGHGLVERIRHTWAGRWAAVRSAGAARLTYEIGLALLNSAIPILVALFTYTAPSAWSVALAVSTMLLVPLRLVYPAGALVLGALAGVDNGFILFVLSASAGYRMKQLGRLCLALGAALGCCLAVAWYTGHLGNLADTIVLAAILVVPVVLPALIGRIVGRHRRVVTVMHRRNVQLHDEQAVVVQQAQARERTRIARDLHDSLGHRLTLISLYAGTLTSVPEEQREDTVGLLRTTSASAMAELRQILGILQQNDADDVGVARPLTSLDDLAAAVRSTGAQITLTRSGTPRPLPPLVEHAAYRVLQEGVTNALRHAAGAPVDVALRYEPDALIAEVSNGPGAPCDSPTSRQGLIGLAERLRLAGGVLHHGPTPDNGFRLAAMLPYDTRLPTGAPAGAPADVSALAEVSAGGGTSAGASAGGGASAGEWPGPPGPVTTIGGPGPQARGDFVGYVTQSARRSRLRLVAAAVGIIGVLGLCTAGIVVAATVDSITVTKETYDAIRVGQPEHQVRAMLPDPSVAAVGTVGGGPAPAGASCVEYPASILTQMETEIHLDVIYRFCFTGGTLVAKHTFHDQATE